MNITLENHSLIAKINTKGAELNSVSSKETLLEYMWSGDPAFWGKTSPVLFPIVGTLKDNTYLYEGKSFSMSRHGFARDAVFEVIEQTKDSAVFSFSSTPASLEQFPFSFVLQLRYQLIENFLEVTYVVENAGENKMIFSIGGHPAFKVPLTSNSSYEDHYLEFSQIENAGRWPLTEGLIKNEATDFLKNNAVVKLSRSLFNDDAVVLKNLRSDVVSVKSNVHAHGLEFNYSGFPYLGIWAAKNADFVCIEPWCGIADSVTHNQQLETKEGIQYVLPNEQWSRTWKVKFY